MLNLQRLVFISLLSFLGSCDQKAETDQSTDSQQIKIDSTAKEISSLDTLAKTISEVEPTPEPITKTFLPIDSIDYQFSNEEYAVELFAEKLIEPLRARNISFEYKLVENQYVKDLTDTIFTFSTNNSSMVIYKTGDKEIIISALIRDDDFVKVSRVKFGMTKREFGQAFELTDSVLEKSHVIRVSDMMWVQHMDFDFRSGNLEQMKFTGYID